MFTKATIFAAAACGMLANAHMILNTPIPYGKSSLTNSPLENTGSDFPCKQRPGVYDITTMNNMPVGETQYLSFIGGATHGGGSCQVSVTLDKAPTQQSQWKVIKSIIGGCPSNTTGNLSEDSAGTDASVFDFEIPKGMPNGEYSLAWTWFNKIGNREMYMNCAPIKVTGGSDNDLSVMKALPDMFVINIPNEDCETVEEEDFQFPSPGAYATTPFSTALGSTTLGPSCAAVTAKGAGAGTLGSAAAGSAPTDAPASSAAASYMAPTASAAPPVASQASKAPAGGNAPITITTMATVTSGSGSITMASSVPAPVAPSASAVAPASSGYSSSGSPPAANGSSSGSCSAGATACSSPGSVVCIGSSQWGLCDINNCAVPQALAGGTSCSGGVVGKKRSIRHAQRHILAARGSF